MLKKALHHFSRTTMIALEIAGVIALVLLMAWLGLIWRLSQGPLTLNDFVKTRLENAFTREMPEFLFDVERAQLLWGGRFEPFEFEMQKVRIIRTDQTPVLAVDRLRVQLSKRNLVFGRFVPRLIHVYGPKLRVIRQEDGSFSLNVGDDEPAPPGPEAVPDAPPAPAPATAESRIALVKGLISRLRAREGLGIMGGLNEIDISDALVVYEDRLHNLSFVSPQSGITAVRDRNGMVLTAKASVALSETQMAAFRATMAYSWDARKMTAALAFTGLNPALVAKESEKLRHLNEVDLPLTGSVNFDLDEGFRPVNARFAIGAEAGKFNAFALYPEAVPVQDFFLKGLFDAQTQTAEISSLKFDLGGPKAEVKGNLLMTADGSTKADLQGVLTDMPMDKVRFWWPAALAPDPREWVTTHLSGGVATKATIDAGVAYTPAAEKPVAITRLGGNIEFKDIRVDYFPPLTAVEGVSGTAAYDAASFNLDLTSGRLRDMTVKKSVIRITDLDKIASGGTSSIDIDVALRGPLKTALEVLDAPPLKYPDMLGIKTGGVSGNADVDVNFNFPISKTLALKDVSVKAKAKLDDVELPDLVAGMDLSGGPMTLVVDSSTLKVSGNARLDGRGIDFDWSKNFARSASVDSKVKAKLALDAAALLKFGFPKALAPAGTMPVTIDYTSRAGNAAILNVEGNLKELSFSVPEAGVSKPAGAPGFLSMAVALQNGRPQRISGLDLKAAGLSAKGDIELSTDKAGSTGIRKAIMREVVFGDTHIALEAQGGPKEGFDIKVTGRQLDGSAFFKDSSAPGSDADAARPAAPLRLNVAVGRLITGKDKALDNVRLFLKRNMWKRLDHLELDARVGGKGLTLRYLPSGGGHSLRFEAENAGQALSILGITNSLRGGRLVVEGRPRPQGGPRDLVGTAILTDFKLNDAPVLARLLNAMSLSGVISLLNGEGLSFKRARVKFSWTDRGQPEQARNVRTLKLSDGDTSGASLGLTFEGAIDQWAQVYDLKGTLIPVSDLNKMVSSIPIIGTVLSGGGDALIAATYTIKGPKAKPEVMVNPLSVLAPGILRKIFFEN